jgi:hypothetical protein
MLALIAMSLFTSFCLTADVVHIHVWAIKQAGHS